MNKLAVYGGAAVAFLIGLGGGVLTRAPEVAITVTVVQPSSGVRVDADGDYAGVTDALGQLRFTRRVHRDAQLRLRFSADNFEVATTAVRVQADSLALSPLSLQPSPVDVAVMVTTVSAGGPVGDAAVSINGEARGFTAEGGMWEGVVSAPYGTQVRVAVDGVPRDQAFEATGAPVQLTFERPAGVPVRITARHGVADIEVIRAGEVFGRTDAEGRVAVALPVGSKGVVLSFRLPGATIADWRIEDRHLTSAGRELKHTIDVRPATDLQIALTAKTEEGGGRPAAGYEVEVGGRRMGVTGPDGQAKVTVPKGKVVIGQRLGLRVRRGTEGIGTGAVVVRAGQSDYSASVQVAVPKVVRLTLIDESGRPVPKVKVRLFDNLCGTSGNDGVADCSVPRLNEVYRFNFDKEGFTAPEHSVRPQLPLTEKEVVLKSLAFRAAFVDSLTGTPVEGLEVWLGKSLLFTTIGQEEVINIPRLGTHAVRLDSKNPRYPSTQTREVKVAAAGEVHRITVAPRPFTFNLTFETPNGRPVANRQVDVSCLGYRDQGRTNAKGGVLFETYQVTAGQECTVNLGTLEWPVMATGYELVRTLALVNKGTLTVRATGADNVRIEVYPDRTSLALKTRVVATGESPLVATELEFRDYEVIAYATDADGQPVTSQKRCTVDRSTVECGIDMSDPYKTGLFYLGQGDTTKAMERFLSVPKDHNRYGDAQTELCFHHNRKGEFYEAYGYCRAAVEDANHQVNPYLYLACAQSSHRQNDFDRGIECAQKGYTHRLKAATPAARRELAEHAQYLEALCMHDRYFEPKDPELTVDEKCPAVQKVLYKWQTLLGDAQNARDADQRVSQCEGEIISLSCQ